jgi:lipopolysaccharide biosynthesis glycosyltransferase
MSQAIPIYIGVDPREMAGLHVFMQSVLQRASVPVAFIPLHRPMLHGFDGQRDGTNAFIYSRFLVPFLQNYAGWAIFADGSDMVCLEDVAKLWALRDESKAVAVVKHDYATKHDRKYIGTPMEADNASYPRKNWSSMVLWNSAHPANRRLTPELVTESPGSFLHRFQWLNDDQIGELPAEWNCLVGEQDTAGAYLLHHTLGSPGFTHYKHCEASEHWHRTHKQMLHMENA